SRPPAGGEPVMSPTEPDAEPVVGPTKPDPEPPRRRELRPVLAAAAAVIALAGAGTAAATALSGGGGGHHPAAVHATTTTPPTTAPSTTAPPPAPTTTPPTTARTYGSAAAGYLPPSAGGATSPQAIPSPVLADTLRAYYALVDQHRLDQSWAWLSPAFQARIGSAYYHQFWNGISQVQVLAVSASAGTAQITLHYVETDGTTSTETATLGFTIGSDNRILIDTDRATSG
ncbi:MAG TPA: hypothetical protein VFH58_17185, partial [Acidimicrobiales bacterium]|nr:hypothetical protein [Acidimicrobiales bacterium]